MSAAPGELLVVAVCAGARCRALRQLHDPSAGDAGPAGAQLRAAVRGRPRSVLVSTECLGPCHRGCVAAVGPGSADGRGGVRWHRPPLRLDLVELPGRDADLAAWIRGGAPDPGRLPAALRRTGAA